MVNTNSDLLKSNILNLVYAYINKLPNYRYFYKTNGGVFMCFSLNIIVPFPESNDDKDIINNFRSNLKFLRTFSCRLANRLIRASLSLQIGPEENIIPPSGRLTFICDPRSQIAIRDSISTDFLYGVLIKQWKNT